MNTIADIVIGTIRAQICGKPYHIAGEITEDVLNETYTFSRAQDMAHLVAAELLSQQAIQNAEMKGLFKKQQILAVYRYERINREYTDICRVLEANEIPYMPLKGSVMRQYYPEPWMRTSADIDILVPKNQVEIAAEALVRELNYCNEGAFEHDIQMATPSGVQFELHFDTIEDYQLEKANKVLANIWEEHAVCAEGHRYVMSEEMFYFYHVAHMAKHFTNGGCGIRFFLDMWLLNHNTDYDHKKRMALLKAGDLYEFAKHAEQLSEVWFGDRAHTDVTERMERHILNGGVYGGQENAMAVQSAHHGGKLGYAMYLVFRPLHELRRTYTILYKHKWLYPFCQVHRWFKLIFKSGISHIRGILHQGADAYEKNGDSVEQMLRDLKLAKNK